MAYLVRKSSKGFRVQEERYSPKRHMITVPREAYSTLGFSFDMTLSEAKARAKQLNQQAQIEANREKVGAAYRVKRDQQINEAYLPSKEVALFEKKLFEIYMDNKERIPVVKKYWNATMRVISTLEIDPKDFANEHARVLNHCKKQKWSHDYIKRIFRLMDQWGTFCAIRRNSYYSPMPKLKSLQIQRIADGREDVSGVRREANPLQWSVLKAARESFKNEGLEAHWNWMFIAAWFGLRPKEVDNLSNSKRWRITTQINGTDILEVYQTKLTSLAKDKRWKVIPIFFDEQKEAVKFIKSGEFKRPLNKTLRRLLGEGIETYSPRKAFVGLFLSRGFTLEDIATFMGHSSIDMTFKRYKDKKTFQLPKSG